MSETVYLTYDGEVLRPEGPLPFEPNTRIRGTLERVEKEEAEPVSFFAVARELKLDGPPDWSTRVDDYLYGDEAAPGS